ncbi:hypothetical protein [Syntrophomonas palmitatica]|uniref:hypothetical protein n=1 Tax=Syntrophomonas palmitatica TaxID=402877 RepID=UPI0006CFC929|nr:hypothetical protein [Syntrophomonas palmitatica]
MLVINVRKYGYLIGLITIFLVSIPILNWINNDQPTDKTRPATPAETVLKGEYLPWEEVNRLFPKFAYGAVIDFEKKEKFAVQRRGGTYHADVQPLTARDTKIMKDIFDGKWTWKRRAVIVELEDGRKIAASMNGMPHGQGAIRGNKFNGHFCIHFRDSKTHIAGKVDTAHQLMIWKAAGLLEAKRKELKAGESLKVFIAAVDQGEKNLVLNMLEGEGKNELANRLQTLDYIKLVNITANGANQYRAEVRFSFDKNACSILQVFTN